MKKSWAAIALAAVLLSTVCRAAPPGMSEVDEMVAKMQIQELMYRYALNHNTNNPQAYADLFTQDADLMGIKGHDAILKMAQGEVRKMSALGVSVEGDYRFGFMRSEILNPVIDIIDATHAKGIAYLQVVVPDVEHGNVPTILSEGTYQDDYLKVNGKWLIARRRATGNRLMRDPGLGAKLGLGPPPPKPSQSSNSAEK